MEGDGGNRELFDVGEGGTRLRGPRTRKPRTNWAERPMKTSNDEAEEGVFSDAAAAAAAAMEANGDVEVSGWRNPRRAATWVRAPDRLALDNNGASGSRVIDFSSDEDDAAGKQHDVIDLASSDSPVPEAAGPSGESPPRRDQRPESADAKRARRGEEPEPEASGETEAPPSLEPYNLRRGRNNLNLGVSRLDRRALASNNGLRGRVRRHHHRLQGLSEVNNLRRPFLVPDAPVVNLDDQDSPSGNNTIVLEDDAEAERARQLAEDERVARELQNSFALEDQPPTDEVLARMLQAEENSHGRGLPIEQRPVFFAPTGMRSLLGGDEDEREARRLFRNELALGAMSDNAASSSRIVRRGYGGSRTSGRALHALAAPPPQDTMNARRVHFPARMGLESRMEFLAALEMALEQYPVGLQLAHLDRDFNENDYEMLLALDTDNHRHRAASMDSINQLPVTTIAPTDVIEEDCSICLETPVVGDDLKRLPCMHAFHKHCIDQWLQHQGVCPVCKANIVPS